MKYSVKALRAAGLEARWTRDRSGAPIIVARNPNSELQHQRASWWHVSKYMWESMLKVGIMDGFTQHTLLGDIFSVKI